MLQVLEVPALGGDVLALGPTDRDSVFVAYVKGLGLRVSPDFSSDSEAASWSQAGSLTASVHGPLGLFFHRSASASPDEETFVSFLESPPRSWVCFRLPRDGAGDAQLVERSAMPGDAVAACGEPTDAVAALALASGHVRFMDLATGKSAGKGLKFEQAPEKSGLGLARLGSGRAALVRETSAPGHVAEFFLLALDTEQKRTVLERRGFLRDGPQPHSGQNLGSLLGASSCGREGKLLLCWGLEGAAQAFTTASVDCESSELAPLPPRSAEVPTGAAALWLCTAGYLAELVPGAASTLVVRDASYGLLVTSSQVTLSCSKAFHATAGSTSLLLAVEKAKGAKAKGSGIAAVRWTLPPFGLSMLVGRGRAQALATPQAPKLTPLMEAVSGKRPRDDAAVEELFTAKRRVASDEALAAEIRARRCPPSYELADEVVRRSCWASARALLALPELDEDLAVKLLAARPELLARLVRRARAPQHLATALRDQLPTSMVAQILETLLVWLAAYRDFPEAEVQSAAPGVPRLDEITAFLSAMADGCLPTLATVDCDLLERVVEALTVVQVDQARTERVYSSVRAICRIAAPLKAAILPPAIEVVTLKF